ncbi:MAG: hypothetical protein IJZ53_04610 [Tyzzerella sp.]|nr:hypothetical protein [Tyzzerella sp.]
MKLWKKIILIIIWGSIVFLFIYKLSQPSHSQKLVSYLENSNINQISVEKRKSTDSTDSGMTVLSEPVFLTSDETERFYNILEELELVNKGTAPIPFKSSIRYYVQFMDEDGRETASLEFYGDELLIFDFFPDDEPSIFKRYEIANTGTTDFFEEVLRK